MNRRHGMTLLELLGIMPLLVVVMILSNVLYPIFFRDVPAANRAIQTNGQTIGILQRIQQDMDCAYSLPSSAGGKDAGPQTLLIQTRDGLVCYEVGDGSVTRSMPMDPQQHPQTWQTQKAVLTFKGLSEGAQTAAVEVHTAVLMQAVHTEVEHLANNHVYRLNALQALTVKK